MLIIVLIAIVAATLNLLATRADAAAPPTAAAFAAPAQVAITGR
jgi:hypothetical protein